MATDPECSVGGADQPAMPARPSTLALPAVSMSPPDGAAATAGSPGTAAPASAILDKLALLDVARRAERERRRDESRALADPRESITQFLHIFSARQRAVEDALQRMLLESSPDAAIAASAAGAPSSSLVIAPSTALPAMVSAAAKADTALAAAAAPPLAVLSSTPEQVATSLDLISAEVLSLEQSAAGASYYLPPYDQKQCSGTVAALRAAIEGARTSLAPRKRFAFGSKKVNKVRGEEVSAAAATTATTSAVAAAADAASAAATSGAAGWAHPAPSASSTAYTHTHTPAVRPCASSSTPSSSALPATGTAAGAAATGTSAGPSATAAASDVDADAPSASLVVSDQDRALVARGRGLMGLSDQEVVLSAEQLQADGGGGAGDFVLLGLTRCRVVLLGRLRALRAAGLRGCTVVAGPVTGACFVDDVRGCTLALATYQVRMHRTHATDLFMRVRSKPIVEHSTGVRVAPWDALVAPDRRLDSLLQEHMLGEETGCWQQVEDFGWIKAVQSPNWSVMPQTARPADRMAVPEGVWGRAAAEGAAAPKGGADVGAGPAEAEGEASAALVAGLAEDDEI